MAEPSLVHCIWVALPEAPEAEPLVLLTQKLAGGAWSFPVVKRTLRDAGGAGEAAEEGRALAAQCLEEVGGRGCMAKALKANPDEMVEAVTWPSGPSRSSTNQFRCSDVWGGTYYYCLVLAGSAESL